jgi:hypothetical protein
MSSLPKVELPAGAPAESSAADGREARIRAGVLAALGRPPRLLRVAVLPVWGDKFRVNVWTGDGAAAAIPNSYFVTADDAGVIQRTEPPIRAFADPIRPASGGSACA